MGHKMNPQYLDLLGLIIALIGAILLTIGFLLQIIGNLP